VQQAQQAHRRAVEAPVNEIAGFLQSLLTRRVTAYIAGVKDAKTVTRWVNGESTEFRFRDMEERLRTAFEVGQMLLEVDNEQTVKAWFVSLNPYLDDVSPVEALREGRGREVKAAARSFVVSG
jgi:hypothetical protein